MLNPRLVIVLSKTIHPFVRKKLVSNVSDEHFMCINSLLILIILSVYYYARHRSNIFKSSFETTTKLNYYQIAFFIFLSCVTIITTLSMLKLDKSDNQSSNIVLLKGGTTLGVILFGAYLNGEQFDQTKLAGMIAILFGIYLINKV